MLEIITYLHLTDLESLLNPKGVDLLVVPEHSLIGRSRPVAPSDRLSLLITCLMMEVGG